MQMIYNGFDGFDVTFQGALPENILDQLAEAKDLAGEEQRGVVLTLGSDTTRIIVAGTGVSGYRYRFSTGLDGEMWFVAHSTDSSLWNIRVSVTSLGIALSGYEAVRSGLIKRLISWGAVGKKRFVTASGKVFYVPMESIGRFDYCYDFIMDSAFEPVPQNFIAHQRSIKHVYGDKELIPNYSALNGDAVDTVRIGQMPGKQMTIYNKTKEIGVHSKEYWWDLWGVNKDDVKGKGFKIWRVEIRAGKNELNAWDAKTFEDFELKAGDIVLMILNKIRYTTPLGDDTNRSRWPTHPLWLECLRVSLKGSLKGFISNAPREKILKGFREKYIKEYKDRIAGNAIGLGALLGDDINDVPRELEKLSCELKNTISSKKSERKFLRDKERFALLVDP